MSGLFESKKIDPEYHSTPQNARINELNDLIRPLVRSYSQQAGQPYTGTLVAPLTGLEQQSIGRLSSYLDSPYAYERPEAQAASNEVLKIFGDEYDPFKTGEFSQVKSELSRYLTDDVLPQLRHRGATSGKLYSSEFVRDETSAAQDILNRLASYAYGAKSDLIARRQQAIPQALGIASAFADEPYNRLAQTIGLAGYERTQYEQPLATARYQDYQRLIAELSGAVGTSSELAGLSEGYLAYPSFQPSTYESIVLPSVNAFANVVGALNSAYGGGYSSGSSGAGAAASKSGGSGASTASKVVAK